MQRGDAHTKAASVILAIRWVFPDTQGLLTRFDASRTTLGRGEQCRVRLDGDDISRLHAEVVWRGSQAFIR